MPQERHPDGRGGGLSGAKEPTGLDVTDSAPIHLRPLRDAAAWNRESGRAGVRGGGGGLTVSPPRPQDQSTCPLSGGGGEVMGVTAALTGVFGRGHVCIGDAGARARSPAGRAPPSAACRACTATGIAAAALRILQKFRAKARARTSGTAARSWSERPRSARRRPRSGAELREPRFCTECGRRTAGPRDARLHAALSGSKVGAAGIHRRPSSASRKKSARRRERRKTGE